MDLREKPGKVQTLLELFLRFRLIAVVAMVIATVSLVAKDWQAVFSLPLGASEALGMWFAEVENIAAVWASTQYLTVAAIACVVMLFVFGGIRAGIASLVSVAAAFAALFLMGGSESMPVPMLGILALVALVLILFAKLSVACGLFPFLISWIFFSSLLSAMPESFEPSWFMWGVFSIMGFAFAMGLSLVAGKHLAAGIPQAGALVKAAKQLLAPVLIGSLLVIAAIAFDIPAAETTAEVAADPNAKTPSVTDNIPSALLYFGIFNAWFFALLFPTMSFAPWERLRSGNRRVELKDKKKKKVSKKK